MRQAFSGTYRDVCDTHFLGHIEVSDAYGLIIKDMEVVKEERQVSVGKKVMQDLLKLGKEEGLIGQEMGATNEYLMAMYRRETGRSDFKTFKGWKEVGARVKKGEKGFAIFSRPLSVIKAEKGEEGVELGSKKFGVCYLFHDGQVERV